MPSTTFLISSNYKKLVEEQANNNGPYAAVRELISNGCDALASSLIFGPLPDDKTNGLFFVDDGAGMPLWTGAEKDLKKYQEEHGEKIWAQDSKGRRCGAWVSFFGFAWSTKDDRSGRTIGHKGQGAKLLLHSNKALIVISKSIDDKLWGYVHLDNPIDSTSKLDVEVKHYTSAEVENEINANTFLNAILDGDDAQTESARLNEFKNKVVKPFLKQKSGTFVIMLGITSKGLLQECRQFDILPLEFATKKRTSISKDKEPKRPQNKKKENTVCPDDKSKLLTHIRFHTVIGHPFVKEAMIAGGYDAEQIGLEMNTNNNIFVRFDKNGEFNSTKHVPKFSVLTSGPNGKPELKEIPIGYPYVPKKSKPDIPTHFPERDGNWAMQARYVSSFKVSHSWRTGKGLMAGSRVTVACNIDGILQRMKHLSMLGRKGGNVQDQGRGGIPIGDLSGINIYAQGVYVGKCNKFASPKVCAKLPKWWNAFLKASQHWQIIIDGNFAIDSKRNELTNEGLAALTNDNVLNALKKIFETFHSDKVPTLRDIVAKMEKRNEVEMERVATETWDKRIKRVVEQTRFTVEVKESNGVAREYAFLQPMAGEENSVISTFSQLSGAIQDGWFDQHTDLQELKRFWPHIFSVTSSRLQFDVRYGKLLLQGIDATGINRGSLGPFKSTDKISTSLIQQLEFKMEFRVPTVNPNDGENADEYYPRDDTDEDEGYPDPKGKTAMRTYTYNHEFIFTDFLVCWELKWDQSYQPGGKGTPFELKDDDVVYAYDYINCYGKICTKIDHAGETYKIPEAMKGYAFFISDLKNTQTHDLVTVETQRKQHLPFVTVFSLKRLIEVTFANDYGSTKWWYPDSNKRKQDEGDPGPSTVKKAKSKREQELLKIIEKQQSEIDKLKNGKSKKT